LQDAEAEPTPIEECEQPDESEAELPQDACEFEGALDAEEEMRQIRPPHWIDEAAAQPAFLAGYSSQHPSAA
jgi:hypothetical protein